MRQKKNHIANLHKHPNPEAALSALQKQLHIHQQEHSSVQRDASPMHIDHAVDESTPMEIQPFSREDSPMQLDSSVSASGDGDVNMETGQSSATFGPGIICTEAHECDGPYIEGWPGKADTSGGETRWWESNDDDGDELNGLWREGRLGGWWLRGGPPSVEATAEIIPLLVDIIWPRRSSGRGFTKPKFGTLTLERYRDMHTLACLYTLPQSLYRGKWVEASKLTIAMSRHAPTDGKTGNWAARTLRQHLRGFVLVPDDIPFCPPKRKHPHSRLDDEDILQEFDIYMQSKGKYAGVAEGCRFFAQPEIMAKLSLTKPPSRMSVHRFILRRHWRWKLSFRGMYIDGHEREDVVEYRQKVFLPWWMSTRDRVRAWDEEHTDAPAGPLPSGVRPLVRWHHDESTYFEHDRRRPQWTHPGQCPTPEPKGEGESIMIADFVSADYGWLRGRDGSSARLVFRAGKERDGYLTNDDILEQAEKAMDLLKQWFPDEDHVLVYDNATTHQKRADDALSARKMPKFTPKVGVNWGVDVKLRVNGKIQYEGTTKKGRPKPMTVQVKMRDARFRDGRTQHLYWEEGTARAGTFKGMAQLLIERGIAHADKKLLAQCPDFNCPPDNPHCCCRRILYNEPDFVKVPSALEELGERRGFKIIFLPKFHCELSMIEMCWGYSKRLYRLNPPSSSTAQMEAYVLEALESIPLETMRRYARRCERFMDAYQKGLTGVQAAWAAKKYHGHRILPPSYVTDMLDANI